jgi:hypothetical protein
MHWRNGFAFPSFGINQSCSSTMRIGVAATHSVALENKSSSAPSNVDFHDERKELRAASFVDIVDGDARYGVLEIGVFSQSLRSTGPMSPAGINDARFSLRRRCRAANSLYVETVDIFRQKLEIFEIGLDRHDMRARQITNEIEGGEPNIGASVDDQRPQAFFFLSFAKAHQLRASHDAVQIILLIDENLLHYGFVA